MVNDMEVAWFSNEIIIDFAPLAQDCVDRCRLLSTRVLASLEAPGNLTRRPGGGLCGCGLAYIFGFNYLVSPIAQRMPPRMSRVSLGSE